VAAVPKTPASTPAVFDSPRSTPCNFFWRHELDAIVYDDKPKESKEDQY